MTATIRIANYRSFSAPFSLTIEPGLIALVGPNNGGKSNVLRFFFEFRHLFEILAAEPHAQDNLPKALISGNPGTGVRYQGVPDHNAIFSNTNDEPISLEVTVKNAAARSLPQAAETVVPASIVVTVPRNGSIKIHLRPLADAEPAGVVPTNATMAVLDRANGVVYDLQPYVDLFDLMAQTLYIGSFRNVINQGANDQYFDLTTGNALVARWNQYQAGDNLQQAQAAIEVVSELQRIFNFSSLQLLAAAGNSTIRAIVDNRPYSLSELGSGVSQFLITIINLELSRKRMILLDEPELGLHPQLQIELLQSIARRAETVLFTTHSLGLARNSAQRVYTVSRNGPASSSTLRDFNSLHSPVELLGELSYNGNYDLGFRKILLVEGPTEVRFVRSLLARIRPDHGVLPLSLGGSSMINGKTGHALIELRRLSDAVYALVDSERPSDHTVAIPERLAFRRNCERIGIHCHITALRCTESYFSAEAIAKVLGTRYDAIGPYDNVPDNWPKQENWRIAEQMELTAFRNADIVDFLRIVAND